MILNEGSPTSTYPPEDRSSTANSSLLFGSTQYNMTLQLYARSSGRTASPCLQSDFPTVLLVREAVAYGKCLDDLHRAGRGAEVVSLECITVEDYVPIN